MQGLRGDKKHDTNALEDDVAASRAVVNQNGSVSVIMPKTVADALGIKPGNQVFWTGSKGDKSVTAQPVDVDELLAD